MIRNLMVLQQNVEFNSTLVQITLVNNDNYTGYKILICNFLITFDIKIPYKACIFNANLVIFKLFFNFLQNCVWS